MEQNISTAINPPPLTLQYCLVDGYIDVSRSYLCKRRCNNHDKLISIVRRNAFKKRKHTSIDSLTSKEERKNRTVKRHKTIVRDNDSSLCEIRPTDTLWYLFYVNQTPIYQRMHRLFRTRCRIPYDSFITLSEDVMVHSCFARWTRCDAVGESPSNIQLLILGCMRSIDRAWTLYDVSETNGISINVNRDFLLFFIDYGSKVLYKKWVLDTNMNTNVSEQ